MKKNVAKNEKGTGGIERKKYENIIVSYNLISHRLYFSENNTIIDCVVMIWSKRF
jgi:hypothetical protein